MHHRAKFNKKSVKRLLRFDDVTVLKMAAIRHLGDIAIFVIFQLAAATILNFQKFEILIDFRCRGTICVNLPNFIKIGQTVA